MALHFTSPKKGLLVTFLPRWFAPLEILLLWPRPPDILTSKINLGVQYV